MQEPLDIKTDGKFYELDEMVRVNCQECVGCCDCCIGMGDTIVLDPYDVLLLKEATGCAFGELMEQGKIELGMIGGLILPYIRMDEVSGACPYLNSRGRCSIHTYRPGMCRLFPLGRNYIEGKMNYILLKDECKKANRSKMKVSRWIGITPAEEYHNFILKWHDFRKKIVTLQEGEEESEMKQINMFLLQTFYFGLNEDISSAFRVLISKIERVESVLKI